jgi:hypothetical protein
VKRLRKKRVDKTSASAPARSGKPANPSAPGLGKRGKKRAEARAAADKLFPAVRPAPVADRGVDRRNDRPRIAPAYMRLTPEEIQRERRIRQAREKRETQRAQARKQKRTTGTDGATGSRTRTNGAVARRRKPPSAR